MRETDSPLVSMVMPAYNARATIQASIDSVVGQSWQDWELIVVDDASQDDTAQIVKAAAAKDSRIALHQNESNQDVARSRNLGVNHARGKWIAFLDSDDLWREDKLEKQLRFMEETAALISYTGTAYANESGAISDYVLRAEREFRYKDLLRRNIMSCSSVIVQRELIQRVAFAEEGELHEDYAAWLTILREVGCAYGLDEPLLIYRMSRQSKSGERVHSGMMTYHAYRQVNYACIPAALLTLRYALHSISKRTLIRLGREEATDMAPSPRAARAASVKK